MKVLSGFVVAVSFPVAACLPVAAGAGPGVTVSGFVRDAAGAGVAHVPVLWKLTPEGDDGRTFRQWQDVLTDGDGRYEVAGVGPGSLEFGVGGEMNHHLEPDLNVTERVRDVPIRHDFRLEGSLVFAGRVDLPGDSPVTVWIMRRAEGGGGMYTGGPAQRRVILGADRTFTFTALCPGLYEAGAAGNGIAPARRLVELTGDERDVVFAPRRSGVVTGRVVLTPETEASYIDVRIPMDGGEFLLPDNGVRKDGSFTFPNVPPGRWRVVARVSRQLTGEAGCRNLNAAADVVVADPPAPVVLAPLVFVRDEDVGLHVTLPPGALEVEGKVTLLGREPWDYERFTAVRAPSGATGLRPILGMASADPFLRPDGSLRLFDVAKGPLRIRVEAFGYETEERAVVIGGPTTVEVPLRRRPGRVVMAPDPWSLGIAYFVIETRPAGSEAPWRRILVAEERARISDLPPPEGRVAFLSPGTYEFRMTTDGHPPATLGPLTIGDSSGGPLPLDFRLPGGRSLSGTLRTRAGGRTADRLLRLFRVEGGVAVPMPERMPFAGSDGFRIEGLPPGRYRIALTDGGAAPLAEVEVKDADVRVDLVLCR